MLFPSSVAVGEGRYANGVLLHPSSAAGGKIFLGANAPCGIFPPLRCRRAPGFFPRQPTRSGIRPHNIFENFLHDGNVQELHVRHTVKTVFSHEQDDRDDRSAPDRADGS